MPESKKDHTEEGDGNWWGVSTSKSRLGAGPVAFLSPIFFFFKARVSCSPGSPLTPCVSEDDRERLTSAAPVV